MPPSTAILLNSLVIMVQIPAEPILLIPHREPPNTPISQIFSFALLQISVLPCECSTPPPLSLSTQLHLFFPRLTDSHVHESPLQQQLVSISGPLE